MNTKGGMKRAGSKYHIDGGDQVKVLSFFVSGIKLLRPRSYRERAYQKMG